MQESIHQALRSGAFDQALALAREWADAAPDSAPAQRALAVVLAQAGDAAAALVAMDAAIALAPEDAGLQFERAALLARSGQPEAARLALDETLGLDPNHLPAYLAQAQLALLRGDLDAAARLARTAARIDPDHPRLAAVEALLALRQGDAARALALASAASERLPDDPQLLSALGFAYLARGHWAFAEQAFRRVAGLLPDARALQPLLARVAAAQGRNDEAFELVAPLLEQAGTDTPALHRVAGLYALQAGRAEAALAHLRRALPAYPDDRAVLQGLMALWQARGDRDDAVATLEAALAARADAGALWAARLALEAPGTADGERVLERWLAAMPDHAPALQTALFARDRAGDAEGAERIARRLLALRPDDVAGGRFLAEAQLARDPDAALAQARALVAAQAAEDDRTALRSWLGRLLDRAGRPAEALAEWQALHDDYRDRRVPLPPPAGAAGPWPALATPAPGAPRPLLVWGAPGSGVERVVDALAAAGGPVLRDRFTPAPPDDPLQSPGAAPALRDGRLDPAALVAQWRAALPARGIGDGNAVDWLPWWDNALLLALRPHLPEGRLLAVVRDPRDMLLDWLASGAPFALETPAVAAEWLAGVLEQLADIREQDLYPLALLRLDAVLDSPPQLAAAIGQALGIALPPPPASPRALPPGRWRAYAAVLAGPFARLQPVAARLGYPDA